MRYLLPLLSCLAVFFVARHFRSALPASIAPVAVESPKPRVELSGLARRADRILSRDSVSAASLDQLYRSGNLSDFDLTTALFNAAARDPEGTWDWIESSGFPAFVRANHLAIVAGVWFDADPDAALARISSCIYFDRSQLAGSLIGKLSGNNPAAIAAVHKRLDRILDLGALNSLLSSLPPFTTNGADLLLALPEGRSRDRMLASFAAKWLEQDSSAAAAWLKQLPPGTRNDALAQFTELAMHPQAVPETGRQLAIDWLLNEASEATRLRFAPQIADAMAEKDPAAALKWANANLTARPLAEATGKILARLLAADPDAARQMVLSQPPGNSRNFAANRLAEQWIATEPAAAVAWWLRNVGQDALRDTTNGGMSHRLGLQWFQSDPDSFRAYLEDPASKELPAPMIYAAVREMMADRETTFDWIATLPKESRGSVIKAAYQNWSYEAPAEAAAAFDSRPELATGDAARQIATNWYRRDPGAAIGWIGALPWGGLREAALAGMKKMADDDLRDGGTVPEDLKKLLR